MTGKSRFKKNGLTTLGHATRGEFNYHGDYVGPGWSAGKWGNSVNSYNPARDEFDQTAKEHDAAYANKGDLKKADQEFYAKNIGKGAKRSFAALLVGAQGMTRWNHKRQRNGHSYNLRASGNSDGPASSSSSSSNASDGYGHMSDENPANIPLPDDETEPAINLHYGAQSNMSGDGQGHEVPIAPVPRAISKIHPDHFNIRLPYIRRLILTGEDVKYANELPVCLIRLNSIYDCLRNSRDVRTYANPHPIDSTINVPPATANQTAYETGNTGPQGRNIWQAHFKYYRVLRADVKLTFLSKFCETGGISGTIYDGNAYRNCFAVGYELVDEDAQISNTTEMFLCTKNAQREILPPPADVSYVNYFLETAGVGPPAGQLERYFPFANQPSATVMTHTYNPDTWQYHVENQGTDTRWTPVGENPKLDHLMAVRMMHMDTDNFGPSFPFGQEDAKYGAVMVQIEYEVQFMECLDSFYKTQYFQAAIDT